MSFCYICFGQVPKISVAQAIKSCPLLLGLSVNKLKLVVEQLHNFGIRNQKLGKVIATSPQLLLQKPQEFHQVKSQNYGVHL